MTASNPTTRPAGHLITARYRPAVRAGPRGAPANMWLRGRSPPQPHTSSRSGPLEGVGAVRCAGSCKLKVLLQLVVRGLRLEVHVVNVGVSLAREGAGNPRLGVVGSPDRE